MRVVFTWPDGNTSVLQREDSATRIDIYEVDSATVVMVSGSVVRVGDGSQPTTELPIPFPIGTRVQVTRHDGEGPPTGSFGRVVDPRTRSIGVEWEGWTEGHGCNGHITTDQGYYIRPEYLVAAPLSQTTTTSYPDCETECAGCVEGLGRCITGDAMGHEDDCLDDIVEMDGLFYHMECTPEEEEAEETPPPAFQIGDAVRITRGVHSRCVGTVRIMDGPNRCGVELPGVSGGINLAGIITNNNGRYFTNDMLERR